MNEFKNVLKKINERYVIANAKADDLFKEIQLLQLSQQETVFNIKLKLEKLRVELEELLIEVQDLAKNAWKEGNVSLIDDINKEIFLIEHCLNRYVGHPDGEKAATGLYLLLEENLSKK